MKKPPCLNCANRFPGCHSRCESYNAWNTEHRRQKEEIFKQKELSGALWRHEWRNSKCG